MSLLVEAAWLAARLNDPNTVVLDATLPPVGVAPPVDTRARYAVQHIPGAVFFDIEELSDHSTNLPHMLPTPEAFSGAMSQLGIADSMSIVLYEQAGVFSAPRAWWMLRAFGARDLHILNGGLGAWLAAGLPSDALPVTRTPATFTAKLDPNAVKTFPQIQGLLGENAQIVDARSAGRFTGALPEPRPGLSSGHMPGSRSLPFTELVADGRLKSPEQISQIFRSKGIDIGQPITTTCGSGVTAAVLSLGLELAGAKNVALYDGSWAEYAQQPDAVIEKSDPDAPTQA
jgi:thiosulfate/3-mercaptopyruvate sulfurtransferase